MYDFSWHGTVSTDVQGNIREEIKNCERHFIIVEHLVQVIFLFLYEEVSSKRFFLFQSPDWNFAISTCPDI